ncbi:MAG: ABC transporter substrate-binding protein [Desulforhopalus sp.]
MFKRFSMAVLTLCIMTGLASVSTAETLKFGFHTPLTGFAAADGKSASEGAKLAVSQINEAGGVLGKQIELIIYDDQAKPAQSIPIANKLIGKDNVALGISGSYSGPTRSAAGVFQEAGKPYISSYAIHPDITRAGDYVFRVGLLGAVQGRAGAELIGKVLGKKKVVIITLQNDFGKALSAGFNEVAGNYDLTVINEYQYSMKDRQFGSIAAKVKADNPEAIYASGYYFNCGPLVSQLRAAGITAPIIGQEGYDGQKFIEIAGAAAEGVMITTTLDRDSKEKEAIDFIQAFEKQAGYPADMVSASAHTAVKVAAKAIDAAGTTDPAKVRDAIAATELKASTGLIKFNSLGEVMKPVQVQIVKDGRWHSFGVIDDPVLLAPPEK